MSIYRATLRGAVLSGVALGALSVANTAAWAQQTPAPTPAPAPATTPQSGETAPPAGETIIVTGTRLRQETFDSPNPVSVIGQTEVENRQVVNTIDLIEDLPLIGIGVNNRGTQVQNGDSFAFPDVLDLGTQRTLTLVNGRRVVSSNPNTLFVPGNASGSQVDLSVFSPNVIDRVDVLAGTGGAIYGADAVAGVVNIITKSNFNGLNLMLQGGLTEINQGESLKFAGTYGTDFMDGRGNITIAADYFHQTEVVSTDDDSILYGGSGIANVLEGSVRRSGAFDATAAAVTLAGGGSIAGQSAFLPAGSDFVRTTAFGPFSLQNPLISLGGTLVTGVGPLGAGFTSTTPLVPAVPVQGGLARPGADPQGLSFFAPSTLPTGVTADQVVAQLAPTTFANATYTGLSAANKTAIALALLQRARPTPYEYYAANPTLDPNLFIGTFGTGVPNSATASFNTSNGFLTTLPTVGANATLFPRTAAPLQFGPNGNLNPFTVGTVAPPYQARIGSVFGGQGYDPFALGYSQVQAGTDRIALAAMTKYDFTDWLRYDGLFMFTRAEYDQLGTPSTNSPLGSTTAGTLAIPIYIDQNPFLNSQALGVINGLQAGGQPVNTIAGQGAARVLYMGRSMADILGGANTSTLTVDNFQITQALNGDFSFGPSDFYWDVAAGYGRSDQNTERKDILDTEFWLAVDAVSQGGNTVCRQQTLANPEPITVRNPATAPINTLAGLTPTAAQVAACKPLNLFGYGAPSQAAINYVTGNANLHAMNSLEYYSGSLGSDVIDLPAGPLQLGISAEYRKESSEFEPSRVTQAGQARTTTQGRSEAYREINEYGFEANLPVFGKDFQYPLLNELSFNYAFRYVEREQHTPYSINQGAPSENDTFSYSVRYKPVEDLTLRAAKSRTVRAAALVELFNPPSTGFTTLTQQTVPCTTAQIDSGPNPAVRRANCVAAVRALGIAPTDAAATTFLASYVDTAGSRSAIAASNPDVRDEEGNTYTIGFTYEPSFVPNLVIAADFFSVDLKNEITLGGPLINECFDSAAFPNSTLGSTPACETFLFGQPTGPGGQFVIPGTNALTGTAGLAGQTANTPAPVQAPFELAFVQFLNLNAGGRQFRGVNLEARYNFDLADVPYIGGAMANWGDINLRGTYFHTQRYDQYADNDLTQLLDRFVGEHTNPEHKVRFDFGHHLGQFRHTLQWFWDSATVTNILTPKGQYPEQTPTFFANAVNYFNYNAEYAINDQLTARLTINNVTDTEDPRGGYGLANRFDGGIGREWIFGINYNF